MTRTTKGTSLAKGPAGLIGLLLLAYGVTALALGDHNFTQHIPNGAIHGKTWLRLEVNGWSGLLFIAAGVLLLLGSPVHWGAKTMSLLVGVVLGAAALVAVAKGDGVLGLFAANHMTEVVWGAAGILLILLSLLPRVGGPTARTGGGGVYRRDSHAFARETSGGPSMPHGPVETEHSNNRLARATDAEPMQDPTGSPPRMRRPYSVAADRFGATCTTCRSEAR